ncbi:hypothetical protein [Piscinibacter sp.]|jgi:hypothetical protein|uniref:hypothetical protein n=1 Tax=Piscinibacter sp. TaxID=1903157 RepID=UPI002F41940D
MENQATLFEDIAKLAKQFVPGSADLNAFMQGRRKDLDTLLTIGRITSGGVQSVTGKQVETLRALGTDLRAALTGQAEGDRSKSEAVREAAQKAIGSVAELAGVVVDAQAEAFDAVRLRAYANVEELKALLRREQ